MTRCPRRLEQDLAVRRVAFDDQDSFRAAVTAYLQANRYARKILLTREVNEI